MKFILIYTTHRDKEAARQLVEPLLKERLIACANYFPITSTYWWKGSFETADEVVALLKTRTENWEKVKAYIEAHHPYETPCIMRLAVVDANDSYAQWIQDETAPSA